MCTSLSIGGSIQHLQRPLSHLQIVNLNVLNPDRCYDGLYK
jgi:hypothetical protein